LTDVYYLWPWRYIMIPLWMKYLQNNDSGIHIQYTDGEGGIYDVRHWDGLNFHDTHTKFHKDWLSYSNLTGGYTATQTHRQHGDRICLHQFFFFKIRKVGWKQLWKRSFLKYVTGYDRPSSLTGGGRKLVTATCFLIPIFFFHWLYSPRGPWPLIFQFHDHFADGRTL
jgi:hypothetical protein